MAFHMSCTDGCSCKHCRSGGKIFDRLRSLHLAVLGLSSLSKEQSS